MPTKKNFTGQYLDDTGLLYYNARYYDPNTARFISADTVVPGNASGGMDGIAVKPLTVSFSEPGFLSKANQENQFGPWFTLSDQERQQLGSPMGPANPQALNRYAYVMGNPLKYTDPSGHDVSCGGFMQAKCGVVQNNSSQPVQVTGERACSPPGVAGCGADGYQVITVILWPGESSTDYGIVDADFITPIDSKHLIEGHGPNEVYRMSGGHVIVTDDGKDRVRLNSDDSERFLSGWEQRYKGNEKGDHTTEPIFAIPLPINVPPFVPMDEVIRNRK